MNKLSHLEKIYFNSIPYAGFFGGLYGIHKYIYTSYNVKVPEGDKLTLYTVHSVMGSLYALGYAMKFSAWPLQPLFCIYDKYKNN